MHCRNCGASIKKGTSYCTNCGEEVKYNCSKNKYDCKIIVTVISVIFLISLVSIIGIVIYSHKDRGSIIGKWTYYSRIDAETGRKTIESSFISEWADDGGSIEFFDDHTFIKKDIYTGIVAGEWGEREDGVLLCIVGEDGVSLYGAAWITDGYLNVNNPENNGILQFKRE